jgi:hypothetical protein
MRGPGRAVNSKVKVLLEVSGRLDRPRGYATGGREAASIERGMDLIDAVGKGN